MIPNLSLSANSSSEATGGRISSGSNVLGAGDWTINNAPNSAVGGQMNKTMIYVAAAVAAYWFLKKKAA